MKKRILIVEDKTDTRMMEKEVLEEAGYEVLESRTAKEGISLAEREIPDLILMDIRLPYKKRGIGAAKLLRRNDKTSNIPIIFVTGCALDEYLSEIKSITRCEYITKPFAVHVLMEQIARCIE